MKYTIDSLAANQEALRRFLECHRISLAWLPLSQTIDIDTSLRMVWYDEYKHTEEGVIHYDSDWEPTTRRVEHTCDEDCVSQWLQGGEDEHVQPELPGL